MDKLIITAAICGAEVTKEQNSSVPYTIEEIGKEAELAYNAGASIIHLHVRNDDGIPTQSKKRFKLAIDEIYNRIPDVIVQPSTGGAVGMSDEERLEPVFLNPEMATLDCGTCNFGGNDIFVNTETTIKKFAAEMNKRHIKPELECFDKGMIDMALRLYQQDFLKGPLHFNFVLGVVGGIQASARDLVFLANSIPPNSTFTTTAIGKFQFPMMAVSIAMGGHTRVGFEDNIYLGYHQPANSNGELVAKVVRLADELGRKIATPQDARKILHLL